MKTAHFYNPQIKKLTTITNQEYYLIINPHDDQEVYFCFANSVKSGWEDLIKNENIKEVEIEFEEKEKSFKTYRQVKGLYFNEENIIF